MVAFWSMRSWESAHGPISRRGGGLPGSHGPESLKVIMAKTGEKMVKVPLDKRDDRASQGGVMAMRHAPLPFTPSGHPIDHPGTGGGSGDETGENHG